MKWPPCLSQKSLVLNFFDWNSNPVHYLKQMVLIKGTRYGAFTLSACEAIVRMS